LTLDFPNPVYHANYAYADGNVRNQDGTVNGQNNPAPAGSTITLFVTGVGEANSVVAPGSVAHSTAVSPVTPLYTSWEIPALGPDAPGPEPVSSVPGFVSAMYEMEVPVPASIQSLRGTDVGNGVMRVVVALQLDVYVAALNVPISNFVGVYVK
jgi:uncharacterized protein (TIGR03437 family)